MANSIDFVVKNGLQVSTNLVVGTYTLNTTPITNGAIISGSVGIGTSNPLQLLHVSNGNAYINNSVWAGNIAITNTTISTSTTSGALTVAGGIGIANGAVIAGNVGIGTTSTAGFTNNVLAVFGTTTHQGNLYITNSSTISGIVFSDGTFLNTAGAGGGGSQGPTGPTGASSTQSVISYTTNNSSTLTFSSGTYTPTTAYLTLYINGVYQGRTNKIAFIKKKYLYTIKVSIITISINEPKNKMIYII